MNQKEVKELAEFFEKGILHNPPLILSERDFDQIRRGIENPPKPNAALRLAMMKARESREGT